MLYNEGFGTLYERMVRKEYLQSLNKRFSPFNILEVKCGFGVDSAIFNNAVLVDDRIEYVMASKEVYPSSQILEAEYISLPFKDESFDLVWTSCLLDSASSRQSILDCISEMKRVSKKHVLFYASNDLHPTHIFPTLLKHKPWIDFRTISEYIKECNLNIIEQGHSDSPPWPSGLCLPSHGMSDSRNLESPFLKRLVTIEQKYIPEFLKTILGHQVFILAEKKHV